MIQKLIHTIIPNKKFLCVEILTQKKGKEYRAITVNKTKDTLSIESTFTTQNFDDLINAIPKNIPATISFTGQGIISKKVENSASYKSKILFNSNLEDFFWYELVQPKNIYISVIRKNVVNETIADFEKHKIAIVDISIGSIVVSAIKQLIPSKSTLLTENYILKFQNNQLHDIEKNTVYNEDLYYDLDGEKIVLNNIIPFSCLVNYLYPNDSIVYDKDFLKKNAEEHFYKTLFNKVGIVALASFFILLLSSYLLLGYYQKKYMNLQVDLVEENITLEKIKKLENDKKNKEKMLSESGLDNNNYISFYFSEITKAIPSGVNLTEIHVFPPANKIKQKQRIFLINNIIKIQGIATSNDSFTQWIKKLKENTWVDNIEIVDFKKLGKTNNFELKLTIKSNV